MRIGNNRGSGALMTTATDLLLWDDALLNGRLSKFVTQKIQEPAVLNNGRKLEYAHALIIDSYRGTKRVWHTGAAGGYSTLLAAMPEHGVAVAVMCNADDSRRGTFGLRIFDMFLPPGTPADGPPAGAASNAPVPNVDVTARAGLFFNERTGRPLRLAVNNNTLTIAGVGPLAATATDRFRNMRTSLTFMSGGDYEVHFLSNDRFAITTKEGTEVPYRRAQPHTPTIAELNSLTGRYDSDELTAEMEIAVEKGNLMLRFYRTPDKFLPLMPVERDTFMAGQMVLRFVRDEAGKVIGYDYGNPILHDVRYTRVGAAR
jgi:hypothetical protein